MLRRQGTTWEPLDTGIDGDFVAIAGRAADDVFALTDDTLLHFDGNSWTVVYDPATK